MQIPLYAFVFLLKCIFLQMGWADIFKFFYEGFKYHEFVFLMFSVFKEN